MNKKNSIWLLVAVWTLVSCGTVKSTREKPAVALAQSSLTPEQQRKYDYFFLEAMRLKEKKDYASAFGLLQHCLDIHPNAASALYEVSQYYMFLRQVPQGQRPANIIITCTDNTRSRLELWRLLKKYREASVNNERAVYYWMDFGNAQTTGQIVIGTVRNKIRQPASKEFMPDHGRWYD